MFDPVGFFQGFNEQQETDERKRVELAQAFQELRAANPYATGMELQSYVQQLGGGRNFLRGGMPSGLVLQGIAESNAAAKQRMLEDRERKIEADNLSMLSSRISAKNALTGMIDDVLLNLEIPNQADEGTFLNNAKDQFIADLGGTDNLVGIDLNQYFTPRNMDNVRRKAAMEILPKALDLIRTSNGSVTADNIQQYLKIPTQLIEPVRKAIKNEYDQTKAKFQFDNKRTLVADLVAEMERGGDPKVLADTFKTDASAMGITLDDSYVNELQVEAERIFNQRQEDRQDEKDNRISSALVNWKTAIMNDPAFVEAVRSGNIERAREIYKTRVTDIIPDAQAAALGQIEDIIDGIITFKQGEQRTYIAGIGDDFQARIPELRAKYAQDNVQAAEAVFGQALKTNEGRTPFNQAQLAAAQTLAKEYVMNGFNTSLLRETWAAAARDAQEQEIELTMDQLYALGKEALSGYGATKLADYVENAIGADQSRAGVVAPDGPVTFDTWLNSTTSNIQKDATAFETMMRDAMMETDPDKLLGKVERIMNKWQSVVGIRTGEINAAKQYSYGAQRWILAGTPGWNQDAVDAASAGISSTNDMMQDLLAKAQEKAEQLRQTQAPTDPATITDDDVISANAEKLREIQTYAQNNTALIPLLGDDLSDDEKYDQNAIRDFLTPSAIGRTPGPQGIRVVLTEQVGEMEKFEADPIAYIRNFNGGSWYNFWTTQNPR